MKLRNLALAVSLVALTACDNGNQVQQNPELLKGQNYITTINGVDVTLSFDANDLRAYGKVVNRYNTSYAADTAGRIGFGPMASTMMMGLPDGMQAESEYYKFMETAQLYKLEGGTLRIKNAEGKEIEFKALEESEPTAAETESEATVTE